MFEVVPQQCELRADVKLGIKRVGLMVLVCASRAAGNKLVREKEE